MYCQNSRLHGPQPLGVNEYEFSLMNDFLFEWIQMKKMQTIICWTIKYNKIFEWIFVGWISKYKLFEWLFSWCQTDTMPQRDPQNGHFWPIWAIIEPLWMGFCQIRLKNGSDQYVESLLLLLLQTNFQSICAPSNIGHISFISHPIVFKFCTLHLLTNPNNLYDTTPCLDD